MSFEQTGVTAKTSWTWKRGGNSSFGRSILTSPLSLQPGTYLASFGHYILTFSAFRALRKAGAFEVDLRFCCFTVLLYYT